jgi:hypothetical protein
MAKGKGMKRAIPRHRRQVAASAARQERAIEKAERQKARRQIERESNHATVTPMSAMVFTRRPGTTSKGLGYGHVTIDGKKSLCGRPVASIGPPADPIRNVECTTCIRAMRKLGFHRTSGSANRAQQRPGPKLTPAQTRVMRGMESGMVLIAPGGGVRSWTLSPPIGSGQEKYITPAVVQSLVDAGLLVPIYQFSRVWRAVLPGSHEAMEEANRAGEPMPPIQPGDIVLLTYGTGTQIARVRRVTRTGSLVVDRFISSYGGRWTTSESPVPISKVLGPMPSTDARAAEVMGRISEPAVAAR